MFTLTRIKNSSFENTPIEKITRKQIEYFLQDERVKSNSLIKKIILCLKKYLIML